MANRRFTPPRPKYVFGFEPVHTTDLQPLFAAASDHSQRLYGDERELLTPDEIEEAGGMLNVARHLPDDPNPPGRRKPIIGAPAGVAALLPLPDGSGEVTSLFVQPEDRGLGLGKILLGGLLAEAEHRRLRRIRAEAGIHNREAIHLLERLGFVETPRFGYHVEDRFSTCWARDL